MNASPLLGPVPDADAHTCEPLRDAAGDLLAMRHLSLLWSSFYKAYLLFGEAAPGGALNGTGWAFSLSDDLVHWAVPTPVDLAGMIDPAGNATVEAAAPVPGRFIKTPGGHTHWEEPGGAWKAPVGNCNPCPGLDACGAAQELPPAVFNAIANATFAFTCTHVYTLSGYLDYVYSVLVDESAHAATGADPSFNIVGQDAALFLVAKKCVGALWDHKAPLPTCNPLDGFARDQRDVVRTSIHFE